MHVIYHMFARAQVSIRQSVNDCSHTEHVLHLHLAYDGDTKKTQHLVMQP